MVPAPKKIAFLHRYPAERIKETNAAFPFISSDMDVLTFKNFPRLSKWAKFFKSLAWIFYAPTLVVGKGYDVIYCDDSFPFYPALVKLASPKSKIVIRLGDLHLMYYTKGIIYKILHFFEKISWDSADVVIPISFAMTYEVAPQTSAKLVTTVLDPVDPQDFSGWENKKNHGTVMFHGLINKNKKIDILLEAARKMRETIFVIVGDGPDKKRLESIAPDNVVFKGWVPFCEVQKQISTCAIGVSLRSDNPGNEYVVTSPFLQYGIMGKPCLVTKRRVFGNYEWQFSGADELVQKIKILMGRSEEEGKKLRQYVLKNHNAKKIGEKIWSIINR